MKHSINKTEKYVVLKVEEEKLNTSVAPDLKALLVQFNSEGIKNIILDLETVKFCDSSGLSAILVGNRLCKAVKGTYVLTLVQEPVNRLISISQLEGVLVVIPKLKEAADYVIMDELERDIQ